MSTRTWSTVPQFAAIATELKQYLAGCDLAGFNLKRFDLPLLINELARCRITLPLGGRAIVDAYEIFMRQELRTLNAASRYYCGEEHTEAHDAAADALAMARMLNAQVPATRRCQTRSPLRIRSSPVWS